MAQRFVTSPYFPDSTPECFCYNAIAHHHGRITTEEYIDHMLAHLAGTRHPEDIPENRLLFDPLSMAIQSCIFEPKFTVLEDTSDLKRILLDSWNGLLEDVQRRAPPLLDSLEANGIAKNILMAMLSIACICRNPPLLEYCITLTNNASDLISQASGPVYTAAVTFPNHRIWSTLFDNGLDLRWKNVEREKHLLGMATYALKEDDHRVELFEVLFRHGLIISSELFSIAAVHADPDTMKYLVTKCDPSSLNHSGALITAADCNAPVVGILIDSGMDVNYQREYEISLGTMSRITPLQAAAEKGNRDVVELLLQKGARKDITDRWGSATAAQTAAANGHLDIAEFIEDFVSQLEN